MSNTTENIIASVSNEVVEAHNEPFYLSAEFWVGVSFVLVMGVIYKPALKAIKTLITNRIARIKQEFQDAEELKLDAQKVYAEYERKLLNVEKEVDDIIKEESIIIEETKERKIKELNSLLNQKQKEVDGKIELSLEKVKKEINSLIINKSIYALQSIFKSKLTKKEYSSLIDKSLSNISKIDIKQ